MSGNFNKNYSCKGCGIGMDTYGSPYGYCSQSCKSQHIRRTWNQEFREANRRFRSKV